MNLTEAGNRVGISDRNRSKILNRLTDCSKTPVNRLTEVICKNIFNLKPDKNFKLILDKKLSDSFIMINFYNYNMKEYILSTFVKNLRIMVFNFSQNLAKSRVLYPNSLKNK